MIAYYKHTNGEAFTLNHENYVGYFNITNGLPYTGRLYSSDSELLSARSTMLADFYSKQMEYDPSYGYINKPVPFYTNVFDLLNRQGFDDIISTIADNNLKCYGNLLLGNPTIYDTERCNLKYYGLSSLGEATLAGIPYKQTYGSVVPFLSTFDTLSGDYSYLDNVKHSAFTVDTDQNFNYFCSDDNALYLMSGNFGLSSLKLVKTFDNQPYYDIIHGIYLDEDNNRMTIINNDVISIFDTSNVNICNDLILIDELPLLKTTTTEYFWDNTDQTYNEIAITWDTKYTTVNPNHPEFIKFGGNLRTSLSGETILLYNKYTTRKVNEIDLSIYNLGSILDLDIRDVDDYIGVLSKNTDGFHVSFFDPSNIDATFKTSIIYDISETASEHKIRFVYEDSNVFSVFNTKQYHYHYISHPEYPSGRLENSDLLYLSRFIWDTTYEKYDIMPILWDYDASGANGYNNLTIASSNKFDNMYMILHNQGRIYTMYQPLNYRFLNLIPLDLVKYFNYLDCSESSIGINLNVNLSNIIKDVLNMFNQSTSSANFTTSGVELAEIQNYNLSPENLHINGNETINVVAFQRIMKLITDIQQNLLPTTT